MSLIWRVGRDALATTATVMTRAEQNPFVPYWDEEEAAIERICADARVGSGSVLSLGCGYFRELSTLARLGFIRIVGVDASEDIVNDFTHRLMPPEPAVEVIVGRAEALPFADGEFDAVMVLFNSLGNFCDWRTSIDEARRVLRPGGLLILSVWRCSELARRYRLGAYLRYPERLVERRTSSAGEVVYRVCSGQTELFLSTEFDESSFPVAVCGRRFVLTEQRLGQYSAVYAFSRR